MRDNNLESLIKEYNYLKAQNLNINMKRGVPSLSQLKLSEPILDVVDSKTNLILEDNVDCRNYGELTGIKECKQLFKELLDVEEDNIFVFGNSSLNIMYNLISNAYSQGICGSTPWSKLKENVKWICPVPGYDRHFSITEYFGIEMINVPLNDDGPDMDIIEKLVEKDELIKGIWCVPKYSNPTGITYSDNVVKRLANLKPKAKDFRIYWDNAYIIHHLDFENKDNLLNIIKETQNNHNEDIVYEFASFSKISLPGNGVACLATSKNNLEDIKRFLSVSTIGFDKINQLRHVLFFKDLNGIESHMIKQASLIKPKFDLILDTLEKELSNYEECHWTKPKGGYFISLDVEGHAKEVIERCKQCGVLLTPAGSAFPYHNDINNENIRIAPTYPSLEEIKKALDVLIISIKIELFK